MKKVLETLMHVMSYTPWGDKLEAAETIKDFILDLSSGEEIEPADIMDVGCAINTFIPSGQALGKFAVLTAAKKAGFRNTLKNVALDALKNEAKKQGVDAFLKLETEAK